MLTAKEVRLLRLFACCVQGSWEKLAALRHSAPTGEPDRAWRETVLMTHVYAGAPRAVECQTVLLEAGGLGEWDAEEVEGRAIPTERGAALFDTIYDAKSPEVRALIARFHPDFARVVHEDCYARILTRAGLTARQRELLAVVALAALYQPRQLASHGRGALRCGAAAQEPAAALQAVEDLLQPEALSAARAVIVKYARH